MRFVTENIEFCSFFENYPEIKEYSEEGYFKTWYFGFNEDQTSIISSNIIGDAPGTIRSGYPESANQFNIVQVQYPEFVPKMLNQIHKYFSFRGKYPPFSLSEISMVYPVSGKKKVFSLFNNYHFSLSEKLYKVSGKVTEFNLAAWYLTKRYAIDDFIFKISGFDEYFNILPEQTYSVQFALNIVVAYSEQELIDIYIDKKENKILYISAPYTLLKFVYELKLKKIISTIQANALDELGKTFFLEENTSRWLTNNILRNLRLQSSSALQICYFITKEERFWGFYSFDLNPESRFTSKKQEIPKPYLIKLSTENMRESLQPFIEHGSSAGIAQAIIPEFMVDYINKTIHFERTYWHSLKLKEVENWTVTKSQIAPLIPKEDRYWIIDGKNWLHEIYGKEFSELFFFV